MINDVRLEFYVPMYRVTETGLIAVNYLDYRNELIEALQANGVSTILSQKEKKVVKDYEFDEEILTVVCKADNVEVLISYYVDLLVKYNKEFQHNFYIYGRNGFNHTILIADGKISIL